MKYLCLIIIGIFCKDLYSQQKEKLECKYYCCVDYGEAIYQKQANIKHKVYRITKPIKSSEEMKFSYNKQGAQTMTGFTIINLGPFNDEKECKKAIEEQVSELESKGYAKAKKEHALPNITYINFKPCK